MIAVGLTLQELQDDKITDMKQRLRFTLIAFSTMMALTILSCKKEKPFQSNAELIGFDYSMCPCCGGTKITIDNVSNPHGDYFLVGSLPTDFNLGNNPKFPVKIKIDWKIGPQCLGNYIDISRIARR